MPEIENRSGLPHFCFRKLGQNGALLDVLVVRGTFDFSAGDRAVELAEDQYATWGDETLPPEDGEAEGLREALKREGDFSLFKPATDVYLTGTARTKDRRLREKWQARLKVGPIEKTVWLYGPRETKRGAVLRFLWDIGATKPTDSVALDARKAFGGCFSAGDAKVFKQDNSAGVAWLPEEKDFEGIPEEARKEIEARIDGIMRLPMPQIEQAGKQIKFPYDRIDATGFWPLPRWHRDRVRHAGTYDEKWKRERFPKSLLPEDFDARFYQAAPVDQVCPGYLKGDEPVELEGMTQEGRLLMRLPGLYPVAGVMTSGGGKQARPLALDTVAFDLDTQQVLLTWRLVLLSGEAERILLGMARVG